MRLLLCLLLALAGAGSAWGQSELVSNGSFETGPGTGWTYTDWSDAPGYHSGSMLATGGNPNAYARVDRSDSSGSTNDTRGFWYQAITVTDPADAATLTFDWKVVARSIGGGGFINGTNTTIFVFVDTVLGTTTIGDEVWSTNDPGATTAWASVSVDITDKLIAAGTYYVKVALRVTGAKVTYQAGFDNVSVQFTGPQPKALTTLAGSQATTWAASGTNNAILRLDFTVTGSTGTMNLTQIRVTSQNDSDADVAASGVKLYFTSTAVFSTGEQLGSGASFSGGTATISGFTKDLPNGTSYVWVTYDLAGGAAFGRRLDARIASGDVTVAQAGTWPSSAIDPSGDRLAGVGSFKQWNGGGWSVRTVLGTDASSAGSTVRLRLDGATTPTGATIWTEAAGSAGTEKLQSIRIVRLKSGAYTELAREIFILSPSKCYANFVLPGDHAAGDVYYLATGGQRSTDALSYESLTYTTVDDFEDGDLAGWTGTSDVTNANDIVMRQGTRAIKVIDPTTGGSRYAYSGVTPSSRMIFTFFARASKTTGFTVAGMYDSGGIKGTWFADIDSVTIPGFQVKTWYSVKVDSDETNNLADIYVNDALVVEGQVNGNTGSDTANVWVWTGRFGNSVTMNAYADYIRYASYDGTASHTLGGVTAGNALWTTAVNWDPFGIPASTDHALVCGPPTTMPTVSSAATCNGFAIQSAKSATVSSNTLTVSDHLRLHGTISLTGGTLRLEGDVTLTTGSLSQTAGLVQFAPSGARAVSASGLAFTTVEVAGGANSLSLGTTPFTVSTLWTLTSGTLNLGTATHVVTGNFTHTGGSIASSIHTLKFGGSAAQAFSTATLSVHHLHVDNSGANVTVQLSGNLTVTGDFLLLATNAATVNLGSGTVRLTDGAADTCEIRGGTLHVGTSTTTIGLDAPGSHPVLTVLAGAQLRLESGGTLKLGSSGLSCAGTLKSLAESARPKITTSGTVGTHRWAFTVSGAIDVYGLDLESLDANGLTLTAASTLTRLDDTNFTQGVQATGTYLRIQRTSGAYTLRLNDFDRYCQYNVSVPAGSSLQVTMENSGGAKGDADASDTPGAEDAWTGEGRDSDPDGDVHVTWKYFKRWIGSVNEMWSVAANWERAIAPVAGEDVLIGPGNPYSCRLDLNVTVGDLTIDNGGTLNCADKTLTITGDSFRTFGGVLVPGTGTIVLSGGATQQVSIGVNPLYNLQIQKSGGTVLQASNLVVRNDFILVDGTYDVRGFQLTAGDPSYGTSMTFRLDSDEDGDGIFLAGTTSSITTRGPIGAGVLRTGRATVTLSGNASWTAERDLRIGPSSGSGGSFEMQDATRLVIGDGSGTDGIVNENGASFTMRATASGAPRLELAGTSTTTAWFLATFRTVRYGSTKPVVTRRTGDAGTFGTFWISGALDVDGMAFSYGESTGFNILSGASLTRCQYVDFTNGFSTGRHLSLARSAAGSFLMEGCTFDDTPTYYVSLAAAGFTLTMSAATGGGVALTDSNIGSREDEQAGSIVWSGVKIWAGNYRYRRRLTVTNTSSTTALPKGAPVEFTFDDTTATGIYANHRTDGNDVRIVYNDGTTAVELDRILISKFNTLGWGLETNQRTIAFPTNASIGASGSDSNYYLYYGYASASAAPSSSSAVGLLCYDGFESGNLTAGGWVASSTAGGAHANSPASGTYSGGILFSGAATAQVQDISRTLSSLSGYTNVYLMYSRRLFEGATGNDQLSVDYFAGGTWTQLEGLSYGDVAATVIGVSLPTTATQIRFQVDLGNFAAVNDRGVVDDVRICANSNGKVPTCAFHADPLVDRGAAGSASPWSDPFNWSPVGKPVSTSVVRIDGGYLYAPNVDTAFTIQALDLWNSSPGAMTLNGTLTVAGDVTIGTSTTSGTLTCNAQILLVGRNFTFTSGTFNAGTGLVNFNGAQTQILSGAVSTTFNNLTTSGSSTLLQIDQDCTVAGTPSNGATCNIEILSGRTLTVSGAGPYTITGGFSIKPGATLRLGNATNITFSGVLEMLGTSSSLATVTSSDTDKTNGGYAFTVTGNFTAQYYKFEYMGANGIRISGSIGSPQNMSDGYFDHLCDSGTLLSFANYSGAAKTLSRVNLKDSAPSAAGVWGVTKFNVRASTTTAVDLTFADPSGPALGEDKDKDEALVPSNILWPAIVTPDLTAAVADDASGGGSGIQSGDRVVLTFSESTNAYAVTSANIDTVLALSGGHVWGAIQSATWSTVTKVNDTLTVTLGSGATVAVGDSIAIGAATIRDPGETNNATGSPPNVSGSFGADTPRMISAIAYDPPLTTPGPGPADTVTIRFDKATNAYAIDAANIDNVLILANGAHTWGAIIGATWSTTTFANDTLTVTLNTGATIGVGDTITISPSTIRDTTGTNDAVGSPPSVDGSFGASTPDMTAAVADDNSGGGPGVQSGDRVTLTFSQSTNGYAIDATNVDAVLALSGGHVWGSIQSALWTNNYKTLTVTLGSGSTIAVGDSITIGAGTIRDDSETNDATGSPPAITGDFAASTTPDLVSAEAEDTSGQGPDIQAGDRVVLTFNAATNQFAVTAGNIDTVLAVASKTWGGITSATWASSSVLIVTFDGTGTPTIVPGDSIAIGANSIEALSGGADATGSPPAISGNFGLGWVVRFYTDTTEATPASGITVRLLRGGVSQGTQTTDASGRASFPRQNPADKLLFYRDDGTTPKAAVVTVAGSPPDGSVKGYYNRLVIRNDAQGTTTVANADDAMGASTDADIPYTATATTLTVSDGVTLRLTGKFRVGAGETLSLDPSDGLEVATDGTLVLAGTVASVATVTRTGGAGSYSVTIDGGIEASRFAFNFVGSAGIVFGSAATIHDFNHGTVDVSNGLGLDLSSLTAGNPRRVPYGLVDVSFTGASGTNVKASASTPALSFWGKSGSARWGASYENDPAGKIHWLTGSVERIVEDAGTVTVTSNGTAVTGAGTAWTGALVGAKFRIRGEPAEYTIASVPSGTSITLSTPYRGATGAGKSYEIASATAYDFLHEAVSLVGGTGGRFRVTHPQATSESFELNDANSGASAVTIENVVWYRVAGFAAHDDDDDSDIRLTLRNCVVARGNVSEANLYNCTVYDAGTGTAAVTGCGAQNSIFENTPALVGLNTTNLFNAASTLFVNPAQLDFHLKAAQNGGTDAAYAWDMDGHPRPAGTWDIGADEFVGATVTPKILMNGGSAAQFGSITRIHFLGSVRGSAAGYNFGYLTSGGGAGSGNNTFAVIRWNAADFEVVTSYVAPAPIVNLGFFVDRSTADANWRAWIYLVLDAYLESGGAGQDGIGDSILCLIDRGDGGLSHPTAAVTDPDYTLRRFGSTDYSGAKLYLPGAAGEYRITGLTLATVQADGADDNPGVVWNSPVNQNKVRWLRMFFTAYKTTATTGGALFKVNADPYDSNSASAPDNQAFGETMWSIKPGDAGYTYNYEHRGSLTFTWQSGFQEIFVPVSQNAAPTQTVLVRYSMSGTSAPAASRNWQATEEGLPVDENRFGASLDGGDTNAACTYGVTDGTVIYNRTVDSASGSGGLRWASRLKDGGAAPVSPMLQPQRTFPNAFAVVAIEGGVQKIWSLSGTDPRNGCLASTGLKLDLITPLNEVAVAGTQDPDWPLACSGTPVTRIWPRLAKLYFGTDRGFVYGYNWNRDGSSTAGGNETLIAGYPYMLAGARITAIFVGPTAKVLIGTDTGAVYQFEP